jgi:hypothetical protein
VEWSWHYRHTKYCREEGKGNGVGVEVESGWWDKEGGKEVSGAIGGPGGINTRHGVNW